MLGVGPFPFEDKVDMVITDLCVLHRLDHASPFELIELAPGVTAEEVATKTTAGFFSLELIGGEL